jgi:hypothetical protein
MERSRHSAEQGGALTPRESPATPMTFCESSTGVLSNLRFLLVQSLDVGAYFDPYESDLWRQAKLAMDGGSDSFEMAESY